MSEKKPEIIAPTKVNVRPRELSDEHFEFRGGGGAMPDDYPRPKDQPVPLAREARLRPEYSQFYPCLVPNMWELAAIVVEKVIAWRLQQRRGLVDRDRVLDPRHFEFRDRQRAARPMEARPQKSHSPQ
ncbi:MAG TPA: hypothetical protein VE399_04150 [Gemmatimonadales bacterium]|nr:hypothetical protein [Gemmatimonadales bacterium]